MAKWVCPVCGYVHTGDTPPEKCPLCGVPGAKFLKQEGGLNFVAEHHVGDCISFFMRKSLMAFMATCRARSFGKP